MKCEEREALENKISGSSAEMAKRAYADAQRSLAAGEFTPFVRATIEAAMRKFQASLSACRRWRPCLWLDEGQSASFDLLITPRNTREGNAADSGGACRSRLARRSR
jgi:hypothetical protein